MKPNCIRMSAILGAIISCLPTQNADAAAYRTWVASNGSGTTCTRASPCADFQAAHNETIDGGEINCVDALVTSTTFYLTVTLSKSITIDCGGTFGGIGGFNTPAFNIDGNGIIVKIRNLSMQGHGFGSAGINFINGTALFVENCTISGYGGGAHTGLLFTPSTPAQLVVTDTSFSNNGSGSTGGAIIVRPQAGGTAQVALTRVTVGKNVFGIAVDGAGSTGGINMTITDSVISGNSQDGIVATSPSNGAPIGVMVKNTKSVNNAGFGIRSIGPATIRVDNSTVTGNTTGLSFNMFGTGGALLTYGNNNVDANGANGAFSGPVALK